jgi:hypothetical protein
VRGRKTGGETELSKLGKTDLEADGAAAVVQKVFGWSLGQQ